MHLRCMFTRVWIFCLFFFSPAWLKLYPFDYPMTIEGEEYQTREGSRAYIRRRKASDDEANRTQSFRIDGNYFDLRPRYSIVEARYLQVLNRAQASHYCKRNSEAVHYIDTTESQATDRRSQWWNGTSSQAPQENAYHKDTILNSRQQPSTSIGGAPHRVLGSLLATPLGIERGFSR